MGVVPGANVGDNFVIGEPGIPIRHFVTFSSSLLTNVFSVVHGSAPDIAGQNKANPIAAVRSAGLLLEHMGYHKQALNIYNAVDSVMRDDILTPDLGGSATTQQVTDAILKSL